MSLVRPSITVTARAPSPTAPIQAEAMNRGSRQSQSQRRGNQKPAEQAPQVRVVGLVIEPQRTHVIEVRHELGREVATQGGDRRQQLVTEHTSHLERAVGCVYYLVLANLGVFILFGFRLEPLPRQGPSIEVHQHEAHALQIIAPTLLDAQMRIDTGVTATRHRKLIIMACIDIEATRTPHT